MGFISRTALLTAANLGAQQAQAAEPNPAGAGGSAHRVGVPEAPRNATRRRQDFAAISSLAGQVLGELRHSDLTCI
jgi:hypothetical protein